MKPKIIKSKSEIKQPYPEIYLIQANEKTARSIITSLEQKKFQGKIAFQGGDDTFNRRAIETLKIDYLISPEKFTGADTIKQRDSGLNHVTAKTAAKNNIQIIIDFRDIQKIADKKQKSQRLAKIIQNIKICRRAKCKIKIWGCEDKYALQAFGFSLGMSSQQIAEAI